MGVVRVHFLFDFGSPNAYLCHRVIPDIEARTGTTFEYVPILLGGLFRLTGNRSPAEAFEGIKNKPEYARRETERFVKRYGITAYRLNPNFPINTVQVMRGAVAALLDGQSTTFVETVFAAMWELGKKMDDPEVIRATLDESGLDGARLLARISDADVKEMLLANTQRAFERGAFGSPTFFVNDEIFFGKDRLREVEEEIERAKAG